MLTLFMTMLRILSFALPFFLLAAISPTLAQPGAPLTVIAIGDAGETGPALAGNARNMLETARGRQRENRPVGLLLFLGDNAYPHGFNDMTDAQRTSLRDKVLGIGNWRDDYEVLPSGAVICQLSVRLDGEWIAKCDIGGQSDQPDGADRAKAAFSDALKRAAVKWGVGRYIYYLPKTWANYDPKTRQINTSSLSALPKWALPEAAAE